MRIPDNIINQAKAQLIKLGNAALPKKLAAWFAKMVGTIEEGSGHVDPRLLTQATGANPDFNAGEAPDAIKTTILGLLRNAIAHIDKPLVRIALFAAVNALGPKLIDQVYDAIYGTHTATTDLVGANLTELADLNAVDHMLPDVS